MKCPVCNKTIRKSQTPAIEHDPEQQKDIMIHALCASKWQDKLAGKEKKA